MSDSLQPHGPQQAGQSLTVPWSWPKFVSVESVLQSNHLILCLLLLLPSVFNQCVSLSSLWYQEACVPSSIQGRGYAADAICHHLKDLVSHFMPFFISFISFSLFTESFPVNMWTCWWICPLKKKYVLPSPILSNNLASDSLTAKHRKSVIYSHCFQFFTSDSFSNSLHYGLSSHYSKAKDCDKVSNTRPT